MTWLSKQRKNFPLGCAAPVKFDPLDSAEAGEGLLTDPNEVVEDGFIPTGMTTGRDNHLDEVVLTAGPSGKTRAQHRLDKTQVKGEEAVADGNYFKANRLQRRKQRLLKKVARQENRDKKRYARKDKAFYRRREENV